MSSQKDKMRRPIGPRQHLLKLRAEQSILYLSVRLYASLTISLHVSHLPSAKALDQEAHQKRSSFIFYFPSFSRYLAYDPYPRYVLGLEDRLERMEALIKRVRIPRVCCRPSPRTLTSHHLAASGGRFHSISRPTHYQGLLEVRYAAVDIGSAIIWQRKQ